MYISETDDHLISMSRLRAEDLIEKVDRIISAELDIDRSRYFQISKNIEGLIKDDNLADMRKELFRAWTQIRIYSAKLNIREENEMPKYQLINTLCESRIFRSKQAPAKFSDTEQQTLFYSVLLSVIAMSMDTKTLSWARGYASKTSAFGNFDFFRTSGTDLYVLTYLAQNENKSISRQTARSLLRIYKALGRGDIQRSFIEQTLLRLERSLNISDTRLRNARRTIANWSTATPVARKTAITQLHRLIRIQSKLAEVLPYLLVLIKGDKGTFGKMTPLKKAAALAGAGLAGLAVGLRFDPNKKGWRVFRNSAIFDGEKMLTETRPTQLLHIVQYLKTHPDIEKIISVHYISDGISAFVRTTDGNAYELEIRPAPVARSHKKKRGVTEAYGDWEDYNDTTGTQVCTDCKGSGMSYDDPCWACEGKGRVDGDGHPIIEEGSWEWRCVNIIVEDEEPECQECYDTGYTTEKQYDNVIQVPCDCKNALEFRNKS